MGAVDASQATSVKTSKWLNSQWLHLEGNGGRSQQRGCLTDCFARKGHLRLQGRRREEGELHSLRSAPALWEFGPFLCISTVSDERDGVQCSSSTSSTTLLQKNCYIRCLYVQGFQEKFNGIIGANGHQNDCYLMDSRITVQRVTYSFTEKRWWSSGPRCHLSILPNKYTWLQVKCL